MRPSSIAWSNSTTSFARRHPSRCRKGSYRTSPARELSVPFALRWPVVKAPKLVCKPRRRSCMRQSSPHQPRTSSGTWARFPCRKSHCTGWWSIQTCPSGKPRNCRCNSLLCHTHRKQRDKFGRLPTESRFHSRPHRQLRCMLGSHLPRCRRQCRSTPGRCRSHSRIPKEACRDRLATRQGRARRWRVRSHHGPPRSALCRLTGAKHLRPGVQRPSRPLDSISPQSGHRARPCRGHFRLRPPPSAPCHWGGASWSGRRARRSRCPWCSRRQCARVRDDRFTRFGS